MELGQLENWVSSVDLKNGKVLDTEFIAASKDKEGKDIPARSYLLFMLPNKYKKTEMLKLKLIDAKEEDLEQYKNKTVSGTLKVAEIGKNTYYSIEMKDLKVK